MCMRTWGGREREGNGARVRRPIHNKVYMHRIATGNKRVGGEQRGSGSSPPKVLEIDLVVHSREGANQVLMRLRGQLRRHLGGVSCEDGFLPFFEGPALPHIFMHGLRGGIDCYQVFLHAHRGHGWVNQHVGRLHTARGVYLGR